MTCFEKYISEHKLPIEGCPHHYGYLEKPEACYCISCYKDCWSREIPEKRRLLDDLFGKAES